MDTTATTIQPTGLARTLLAITLFFVFPTTLVIILRCWVRLKHKIFGIDDDLMLTGWMLHMAVSGITARSTYAGVGMKAADLNPILQMEARKYLVFSQLIYCISMLFIKGAICVTLLRIAVTRIHRAIIWAMLVFTTVTPLVAIFGQSFICRPLSAAWGHPGKCAPAGVIAGFGYLVSSSAIITDWGCAILPIFMLWNLNMKMVTKVSVGIILGLGALASICTVIRVQYGRFYSIPENYLYNVAGSVLLSVVESGIGIIAGSLPSLRKLIARKFHLDSSAAMSSSRNKPFSGSNRAIITSSSAIGPRQSHINTTALGKGKGNWERLDDNPFGQKIFVKVDLEMQTLERPARLGASQGSREDLIY